MRTVIPQVSDFPLDGDRVFEPVKVRLVQGTFADSNVRRYQVHLEDGTHVGFVMPRVNTRRGRARHYANCRVHEQYWCAKVNGRKEMTAFWCHTRKSALSMLMAHYLTLQGEK